MSDTGWAEETGIAPKLFRMASGGFFKQPGEYLSINLALPLPEPYRHFYWLNDHLCRGTRYVSMRYLLFFPVAASLFLPSTVHASTVDIFTLTGGGGGSVITFQLPATPTSPILDEGGFEFDNVLTSAGLRNILFFDASSGGGLSLDTSGLPYGPQLFSGTDANPTFLLNTFQLSNSSDLATSDYTLSIQQVSTTPEPSALLLLGTGALALSGVMRRRLTA